jgi:tetratricopeptide (TPR) repeat protein
MFDELIHSIMEQWSNIAVTLFAGVGLAKVLSVVIPLFPAAYGVYIKWRNSGYRLVDRLEEFLQDQEGRLEATRSRLSSVVKYPTPAHPVGESAFPKRQFNRALRNMDWGFGTAAVNDLTGAVQISAKQEQLSRELAEEHKRRQALAHLLLGARAASRESKDPLEKSAKRAEALAHFERALEINPSDEDALEYSGLMCLDLANPAGALTRFNSLIQLRQSTGGAALARAYQLQATAYQSLSIPQPLNANNALTSALNCLPPNGGLDRAYLHEQQGNARLKLGNLPSANQSFQQALTIYQALRGTKEGQEGLSRVSAAIAQINRVPANDGGNPAFAMTVTPPVLPKGKSNPANSNK